MKIILKLLFVLTISLPLWSEETGFYTYGRGCVIKDGNNTYNIVPKKGDSALWGYVDETGTWVIKPQFHQADSFYDRYARVMRWYSHNGNLIPCYNFVDLKGKLLLETYCDYASEFSNSYAVIGNRCGEIYTYSTSNSTLSSYEMCLVDTTGRKYEGMCANVILQPDSIGVVAFLHHDWIYNFELGNLYRPRVGVICLDSIINTNGKPLPTSLYSKKESPDHVFISNDTIWANSYYKDLNNIAYNISHSILQTNGLKKRTDSTSNVNYFGDNFVPFTEDNRNLKYSSIIYPIKAENGWPEWFVVSEHGFYGLLHNNSKDSTLVIPTSFSKITLFTDSVLLCKYYNGKEILYNTNGDVIGEPHDKLRYLNERLILTGDYTNKSTYDFYESCTPIVAYGVMNKIGKTILPTVFECKQREFGVSLVGNSLWAIKDGCWGAYDLNGKQIVSHRYKHIQQSVFGTSEDNLVQATDSIGRITIFDKNGRDIAGPIFASTSNLDCLFEHQLIRLHDSKLYGIMRLNGTITVKPCYDNIDMVVKFPIAKVCQKSKWGVINLHGTQKIPLIYDKIIIDMDEKGDCICQCFIGDNIKTIILKKLDLEKI